MKSIVALLIFVLGIGSLRADDFTLINGKVYKGITVTKTEPDGITVMTDSGVEKLYFVWLPKQVQQKYGYNPQVAAAYSAQSAQAQQALSQQAQQEAAAQSQQAAQAGRAELAAKEEAAKPRIRIIGNVEQITDSGILVKYYLDADWMANGGNVTLARSSHNRPKMIEKFGEYFITGHPKQAELVDGGGIDVDAVADGVYRSDSGETLSQFKTIKAYADPFK